LSNDLINSAIGHYEEQLREGQNRSSK